MLAVKWNHTSMSFNLASGFSIRSLVPSPFSPSTTRAIRLYIGIVGFVIGDIDGDDGDCFTDGDEFDAFL
jgi:hypothetical protein